jgi:hypothetical protein
MVLTQIVGGHYVIVMPEAWATQDPIIEHREGAP